LIHWFNGAPLSAAFKQPVSVDVRDGGTYVVSVKSSAVFTNWIALKARLVQLDGDKDILLDLSETWVVDHTVMEALHELEVEYEHRGRKLTLLGLENHVASSAHPQSARKKTIRPTARSG
jgi:MFS superfamily sulfate permease-like transporter